MNFNELIPFYMNDSEEFKPSLKQINEDIRPTWEGIKKQSEVLVNKLG